MDQDEQWLYPRYPLVEGTYRGRLGEFSLRIARALGYTGKYDGERHSDFGEVVEFFRRFSNDTRTLIRDVVIVCSEHGHLSEAEMIQMKNDIFEIERKSTNNTR